MADPARTVAIVGAGFSGTAAAIHLIRRAYDRRLRVLLLERGPHFGRGVAYAASDYPYLLNVPASRMSVTASDPDEFLRFAQTCNPATTGEDFLPRALFGDYLQHLLRQNAASAPPGSTLECVHAHVVDLQAGWSGRPVTLELADGGMLTADAVVLAPGQLPAVLPAAIRHAATYPGLRKDPRARSEVGGRGPLLIVGTGLTMVDVVCASVDRNPGIEIHALSRHGLVPPNQTQFQPDALADDSGLLAKSAGSTRRLVARNAASCGGSRARWRRLARSRYPGAAQYAIPVEQPAASRALALPSACAGVLGCSSPPDTGRGARAHRRPAPDQRGNSRIHAGHLESPWKPPIRVCAQPGACADRASVVPWILQK